MVTIRTGGPPQAVNQSAQKVLFVEGTPGGFDVTILGELLTPKLRVKPLGPSFEVRSVAKALHAHHPEYYFLIDRDDWDDKTVEKSWKNFPDPQENNLLIWRRKELESYFLEPEWVCSSQYLKTGVNAAQVKQWLATEANKTIWLEAANRVLIASRNRIKRSPGAKLKPQEVQGLSRDDVLKRLLDSPIFAELRKALSEELVEERARAAFDQEVAILSGGHLPLQWGQGRWQHLVSAKALFASMVNQHFRVPNLTQPKTDLKGPHAQHAIAVDLLKRHQDLMPADFRELKALLDALI